MEYRYLPLASKSLSAPSAQVPVPFTLKPVVMIEEDGGMLHRTRPSHHNNE